MKNRAPARKKQRRKRKTRSANPFYDESGEPTKKLLHLIWCANFEDDRANIVRHCQAHGNGQAWADEYVWVAGDPLTQVFHQWIHTSNAEMLEELAAVVRDCRTGFKKVRDRATIFAIRAYNQLLTDPQFDAEKPPLVILKNLALELLAQDESRLNGGTHKEQKIRLEKQVRWTSLLKNLRPVGFARMRRGRPPKQNPDAVLKTPFPSCFSWEVKEFLPGPLMNPMPRPERTRPADQ
jgi:hypothetical protein